MHHYRIIYIKNQLGYLCLKYFKMKINLPNTADTCLLIFEANHIKNNQK